jgi:hypothetical protein
MQLGRVYRIIPNARFTPATELHPLTLMIANTDLSRHVEVWPKCGAHWLVTPKLALGDAG